MPHRLVCEGLGKRFGDRWVFRGLSVEVSEGQSLVVSGANGSGKSTFLRVVAGLTPVTEGEIRLQGVGDSERVLRDHALSKQVGWSATDGALYSALSALEHLQWWVAIHGALLTETELRAHLARFELGSRADDWTRTFSTGMRQRLRLAMATLCQPRLLILDEPTAGMDEAGKQLLTRVIDEQRTRGITLLATNQPDEYALGDFRLVMGA